MSFLFSQPRGVVKTPTTLGEILTSRKAVTCLLFIYPHLAHSLPVYGIISRCPMNRIQVASDNAGNLSSSSLLLEFIWFYKKFNSLLRGIKSGLWAELNPRPTFHRVSPPKSCYSQWKHRCFLYFMRIVSNWRQNDCQKEALIFNNTQTIKVPQIKLLWIKEILKFCQKYFAIDQFLLSYNYNNFLTVIGCES